MKKQNLIITSMTIFAAAIALTGCGNQKDATANVTKSNIKTAQVTKVAKDTKKVKIAKPSTADQKITDEKVESEAAAVSTSNKATQAPVASKKATAVHVTKSEAPVVKEKVETDNNLDFDQATLKQLVNVGMGYVAAKTDMQVGNGYWDYAKSAWGITDAQVLVKTGADTYQIFSQGAEQFQLTINGDTAVITARSNYTQTTNTITMNVSSMSVVNSTF